MYLNIKNLSSFIGSVSGPPESENLQFQFLSVIQVWVKSVRMRCWTCQGDDLLELSCSHLVLCFDTVKDLGHTTVHVLLSCHANRCLGYPLSARWVQLIICISHGFHHDMAAEQEEEISMCPKDGHFSYTCLKTKRQQIQWVQRVKTCLKTQ